VLQLLQFVKSERVVALKLLKIVKPISHMKIGNRCVMTC